jgi:hypothetical protein
MFLGKGSEKLMVLFKASAVPERLKNAVLQNAGEVFSLIHMHDVQDNTLHHKTFESGGFFIFKKIMAISICFCSLI